MNQKLALGILLIGILFVQKTIAQRFEQAFNTNWNFVLNEGDNSERPSISSSNWRAIDIPHDWAFEEGISKDGAQKGNGGYFGGGIGWYSKSFEVPENWMSKKVSIEFDGVYMNSEVWINEHYLGKRPYGYVSFAYELSPYLQDGINTITVKVDNSREPSARWYHPCGIYAPVKLVATSANRISRHGVFVTTPEVTKEQADLNINTTVENLSKGSSTYEVINTVWDSNENVIGRSSDSLVVGDSDTLVLTQNISIDEPLLWSPESPDLYIVKTQLFVDGQLKDEISTPVGIRTIDWKTESGFWLNGELVKLLGVCEHFEGGPIGGAWTEEWMRWKLHLLKDMGCNAIRAAHNPAPDFFYDLCDEMGFLVMDEIFDGWKRKAPEDYGKQAFDVWWKRDLSEWIKRNRNHPSIIIYSVGNETGGPVAPKLVETCHQLDSTRLVTSGHSGSNHMDVYGVNGGSEKKQFFEKERPNKPFVSTEAPHTWQTRGYYRTKTWYRDGYSVKKGVFEVEDLTEKELFNYEWSSPENWKNKKQHFNSSYDNATVRITARKNWELMRDLPWYSGHFRWTGFDYYGEATYVHGGWPFRLFMSGAIDVAGFEKDLYYFYQSQWTKEPMVHILPNWTHPKLESGTLIPVWVYSNAEEVELFLNGKSLGKDKPGTKWDEMQCEWMVPWNPGKLEAVAFSNKQEVSRTELNSASSPAKLKVDVESDKFEANGKDIAIVTTSLIDTKGHFYPYGENRINYHFDGPVRLRSLESGSPVDTFPNVNINHRRAFMGSTRAFLQATTEKGDVGVVMAAIIGERQLLTSNKVSIDVSQLTLRGTMPEDGIKVYYTTDGTKASTNSKRYKKPFKVKLGTTVKALIVRDGKTLFEMEETFSKDAGLYWGDVTYESLSSNISGGMQAEDATFEGAKVLNKGKDFFGKGYLDFNNKEGFVKWYQENDGSAGDFVVKIRYASNDPKSKRSMDLIVNGKKVDTISFKKTGSWNSKWLIIERKCKLQGGANYIELRTNGVSAPNIDELRIE